MPPVSKQGTDMPRQRGDAVMDIVGAAHRDGRERRKIARQWIGPNGLALDDAGVAVAGLATRRLAVDQHDRPAAALQMQRSGDPDHPGAENDNTSHCCDHYSCMRGTSQASCYPSLRAKRSNPWARKGRMDCFVAALLAMTAVTPPLSSAGSGRRK